MLVKYFEKQGDKWAVLPEIRNMVTFKPANLLSDVTHLGQFDIVFCRNVLIYFDIPTKAKVLATIRGVTRQDGVLMLGGAESVIGLSDHFKTTPDIKSVYVRTDTTFASEKKPAAAPDKKLYIPQTTFAPVKISPIQEAAINKAY